jgi:DNA-binding transcriptional MerR regulator
MAWSTQQLADLAGTSLRAVRHYHEVGLLAEPERLANGYKQYRVPHLLRLLQIKRLAELGHSLPEIAKMRENAGESAGDLRALDAELVATIARLERMRVDLALALSRPASGRLSAVLDTRLDGLALSEADHAFAIVLTRVLSPAAAEEYHDYLQTYRLHPVSTEFTALAPDADEPARSALARRLAEHIRDAWTEHPTLRECHLASPLGAELACATIDQAMHELYHPAQLDVLRRAGKTVREAGASVP